MVTFKLFCVLREAMFGQCWLAKTKGKCLDSTQAIKPVSFVGEDDLMIHCFYHFMALFGVGM